VLGGLQFVDDQPQEQHVLEHPARQRDGVEAGRGAGLDGRAGEQVGEARVEAGGDQRDLDPGS